MTDASHHFGVTRLSEDSQGNIWNPVTIFLWSNLEISNVDLKPISRPSHVTATQYNILQYSHESAYSHHSDLIVSSYGVDLVGQG